MIFLQTIHANHFSNGVVNLHFFVIDDNMQRQLGSLFIQSLEDSEIQDASNENPSAKTIEDFPTGHEVQVASGYELTSSQVNIILFKLTHLNTITMKMVLNQTSSLLWRQKPNKHQRQSMNLLKMSLIYHQ